MRHTLFAALAATTLAGCAGTPPPAPMPSAEATKTVATNEAGQQVICYDEPVTGTRLRRERNCATAQEWERRREEDQRALGTVQRKSGKAPSGS
jgi:hypothetical protein